MQRDVVNRTEMQRRKRRIRGTPFPNRNRRQKPNLYKSDPSPQSLFIGSYPVIIFLLIHYSFLNSFSLSTAQVLHLDNGPSQAVLAQVGFSFCSSSSSASSISFPGFKPTYLLSRDSHSETPVYFPTQRCVGII